MSAEIPREVKQTRRLLWPLVGLLLLSMALQGASLVAVLEIDASAARSRQQISAASGQRAIVEQFESTTYLALVGLATSDWELLLRQRTLAQELTDRFHAVSVAMLDGGHTRLGDVEVRLPAIEEPELRAALTEAHGLWNKAHAAHVRVLRSENRSLKHNPDLEQFRAASGQLVKSLGALSTLMQRRTHAKLLALGRLQRAIPVAAFLLTLGLFAFVLGRILLPFTSSTEELARSEAELRRARDELEQRVAERTLQLSQANEALRHAHDDLEVRVKERTQELKDTQRRAVELARQAGMAELATNVLHNVGNVLNSINTSSMIMGERLQALRVESLAKICGLLQEHRDDLGAFFTTDERGRRLPELLDKLAQHLAAERTEMVEMSKGLERHVEHIRMIVDLQQTYATSMNIVEATSLEDLLEDAVRISAAALGRHSITLEREIAPLPRLMVDKHKLLQIILNLISNAKYAMGEKPVSERRLFVKVDRPTEERVRVQITDNGVGIEPELLTKIFQHGFTTRKEGHGFGLHSSALAAQALGGSLVAHSDGPGKGASFTLELPYRAEPSASARTGS